MTYEQLEQIGELMQLRSVLREHIKRLTTMSSKDSNGDHCLGGIKFESEYSASVCLTPHYTDDIMLEVLERTKVSLESKLQLVEMILAEAEDQLKEVELDV